MMRKMLVVSNRKRDPKILSREEAVKWVLDKCAEAVANGTWTQLDLRLVGKEMTQKEVEAQARWRRK